MGRSMPCVKLTRETIELEGSLIPKPFSSLPSGEERKRERWDVKEWVPIYMCFGARSALKKKTTLD